MVMVQKRNDVPEKTLIAIVSDVTLVQLMEMDHAAVYWGVITEDFPREEWNRVSRVMNFVQLGTYEEFVVDEEGIVTFGWSEIRIISNRQNLHLDRRLLEADNIPTISAKPSTSEGKRKFRLPGFIRKSKPDCGCGG